MIDYILASNVARESSEALADSIARRQGAPCAAVTYARQRRLCIRYGSLIPSDDLASLNSLDSVRNAANKLGALITLDEAGVSVPRLTLWDNEPRDYPRLLRRLRRFAGNDNPRLIWAGQPCPLNEYDYALEYIHKLAEYRIHVCRGEVIRTQRKRMKRDGNPHPYIWTSAHDWVLLDEKFSDDVPSRYLSWLGIRAVEALGLDFGAVDIAQGKWGLYVLEVNTAPGITNNVEPYASAFLKWAKEVQI